MQTKRNPEFTGTQVSESTKAMISAMVDADYGNMVIIKELKVSPQTIAAQIKRGDLTAPRLVESIKKGIGAKLTRTADRALDHITDAKLERSSAHQLAVIAAINIDKMLLLDGKPTQIHAVALFQQVQDEQAALKDELSYLQDAIDVTPEGCI